MTRIQIWGALAAATWRWRPRQRERLFPAVEKERRIIAGQDNHWDTFAELRQDLLDEPRVGLMEADVHSSKRFVTWREVPRCVELALRVWVRGFMEA